MKRLLILVAAVALLTTACKIEVNAHFIINADKSGTVKLEIGMDDEVMQFAAMSGETLTADTIFEDMDLGDVPNARVSEERRGNMTFFIVEVPIDDITEAQNLADGPIEGFGDDFSITFTDDRVTVQGRTTMDDALGGAGDDMAGMPPEMMAEFFEINLRITMPGKVLEHNATSQSGSTLTWNLDMTSPFVDIYAQSDPRASAGGGGIPIWVWIAAGGALALVILFLVARSRGGKPAAAPATAAPTADAPPPPPPAE